MRKVLFVFLPVVLMVLLFSVTVSARADDVNQYDPNNDPTRINPSPLDERIRSGSEARDSIISRQNAEELHETRSRNPQNTPSNNPTSDVQPSQGERMWQTGLQEWYSRDAKYQLTNWTFSKNKTTVELVDRNGKRVGGPYTLNPVRDRGFVFSRGVAKGTQFVVPEGCEVHCNPSTVNMQGKGDADVRGAGVAFYPGEVVYYTKTASPGFTIFPYHAYPID